MIKHQIKGNASQMIVCQLDQGQTMYCEAGKFLWKTVETRFTTQEQEEATRDKGLLGQAMGAAVQVGKRALAGESLAIQYFTPAGGSGLVAGCVVAFEDGITYGVERIEFDAKGVKTAFFGGEGCRWRPWRATGRSSCSPSTWSRWPGRWPTPAGRPRRKGRRARCGACWGSRD